MAYYKVPVLLLVEADDKDAAKEWTNGSLGAHCFDGTQTGEVGLVSWEFSGPSRQVSSEAVEEYAPDLYCAHIELLPEVPDDAVQV